MGSGENDGSRSHLPPWPLGTLVRAQQVEGVSLYLDCGDHILEARTDAQAVEYGSGWVQRFKCLMCGRVTEAITTEFFEIADRAWLLDRIEYMKQFADRIDEATKEMERKAQGKQLKPPPKPRKTK